MGGSWRSSVFSAGVACSLKGRSQGLPHLLQHTCLTSNTNPAGTLWMVPEQTVWYPQSLRNAVGGQISDHLQLWNFHSVSHSTNIEYMLLPQHRGYNSTQIRVNTVRTVHLNPIILIPILHVIVIQFQLFLTFKNLLFLLIFGVYLAFSFFPSALFHVSYCLLCSFISFELMKRVLQ